MRFPAQSRQETDYGETSISVSSRRSSWYGATFVWLAVQTLITVLLSFDAVVPPHEIQAIHRAINLEESTLVGSFGEDTNGQNRKESGAASSRRVPWKRSEASMRGTTGRYMPVNETRRNGTTESLAQTFPLDPTIAYPASLQHTQSSEYAFAFVIGGCDVQSGAYKGYLYTVLIAARLLRRLGSVADVVCLVQMKYSREEDELPDHQVEWLRALDVHLYYIPKSSTESFYETVLNKFRILALEQYRRVILLDGDVIPVRNMDYLFALSDYDYHFARQNPTKLVHPYNSTTHTIPPRIRENAVVAGTLEPANGGFFMLAPKPGSYEELQGIVKTRAEKASQLLKIATNVTRNRTVQDSALFDVKEGWGHVIQRPDRWTTRRSNYSGIDWDFLFAYSDQGLLYHWTKYVQKDVSIIFEDYVENWSVAPNGSVALQETLGLEFFSQSTPGLLQSTKPCEKFMCDFVHFSGRGKPWMFPPIPNHMRRPYRESFKSLSQVWWSTLVQLNESLQMNLNFSDWELAGNRPDFGFWAKQHDLNLHVYETVKEEKANSINTINDY